MARTAGQILRQVAKSWHYRDAVSKGFGMCWALSGACGSGIITKVEKRTASAAIQAYLAELAPPPAGPPAYLHGGLPEGLRRSDSDYTHIYTDWANRPRPQE